jgi:hypothetical protein
MVYSSVMTLKKIIIKLIPLEILTMTSQQPPNLW